MKRLFLAALFGLMVLSGAHTRVIAVPPAPWEVDEIIGNQAPGFSLPDMDGKAVSLRDFKGKAVFINFWATWCPPCKEEIPSLNELLKKTGGKDVVILSISTDDSKKPVEKFIKEYDVKFTILLDEDGKVMRDYKVFSLPMSFLIDTEGRITEKFMGAHDWADQEFLKKIENLK